MNRITGMALVSVAIALVAWQALWPDLPDVNPAITSTIVTVASGTGLPTPGASQRQSAGAPNAWFAAQPESHIDQSMPAAQSMAETRMHGDPRSPPTLREREPEPMPTSAELNDPQAYLAFEQRQSAQLISAYSQAAQAEIPRLQADIVRARAMGIAEEKIARIEAKVRGLEAMRDKLIKDSPVGSPVPMIVPPP